MSSLLDRISELEQQLVSLRAEVEKKEKENKRWRGKVGDMHWSVDSNGKVDWLYDCHRDMDNFHYDTHNYFQTEEEAQKYANVLETERQLKKFADEHNGKIDWSDNDHACLRIDDRSACGHIIAGRPCRRGDDDSICTKCIQIFPIDKNDQIYH